jgi:hypothetical protein
MQTVRVRADVRKNRLYVVLAGFFDDDDARQAADEVIQEIKSLRPGFDVINDISGFRPATQKGAREMVRAQRFARAAGVDRVIRIVPSETIGSIQFARTSKQAGYEADTAVSIAEADKMLGPWWLKSAGQQA